MITAIMAILFSVLVVLKLLGLIAISWWWVFAPLWGIIAFLAALFLAIIIGIIFFDVSAKAATRLWKRWTGKKQ